MTKQQNATVLQGGGGLDSSGGRVFMRAGRNAYHSLLDFAVNLQPASVWCGNGGERGTQIGCISRLFAPPHQAMSKRLHEGEMEDENIEHPNRLSA